MKHTHKRPLAYTGKTTPDGTLDVWDARTGERVRRVLIPHRVRLRVVDGPNGAA